MASYVHSIGLDFCSVVVLSDVIMVHSIARS